ncbi:MAG TPA: phosphonate ABC transporter ATP-binding protein [Bdellovibrio sp.]|nr:phosphonate ABC transporter ATP-binding protein [Bdellovibrio sp.]
MSEKFLRIKNLSKTYPNGVQALRGVNFDVEKGEFLVIIGLSGSGKSTLMRCLNRLQEATSGEIYFQGQDVGKLQKPREIRTLRRQMGMIFQHFNLIPRQNVLKNVLMGRLGQKESLSSVLGLFSEEEKSIAQKNLQLMGIADKAFLRADQLSGGQKQRVAIARALTQNPALLLADEPVASLDPATCHVVMDYLQKVNRELGITVIANLHFLSLVRKYATRVIALKAGEIVFTGKPEEITQEWFQKIYGEGAQDVSTDGL